MTSSRSGMKLLAVIALCLLGGEALPHLKFPSLPTSPPPTPPPTSPPTPEPTIALPTLEPVEISTQTAANAGTLDSPCGPLIAVGTGVGLKIREGGVARQANAQTGARGGCGPLFAQVEGGTTTKVDGKDPLSADSTTTLIGVQGISIGISDAHTGALVPSGRSGVPSKAIGAVALASGIASEDQKTTHAGSGTVSTDGTTVTNTAGDQIKAQVHRIIKKSSCRRRGGPGCRSRPTVSPVKPTLPAATTAQPDIFKH